MHFGRSASMLPMWIVTVAVIVVAVGCPQSSPTESPQKSQTDKTEPSSEVMDNRCDDLLASAVDIAQPKRLDISSTRDSAAALLNQWLGACDRPHRLLEAAESQQIISKLISPQAQETADAQRFGERDVSHVRSALLYRVIAERIASQNDNDPARAVALFNYVCRNVILTGDRQVLPATSYEVLLLGRGSPEDRAWLFAELLRQLRIDAVILRAAPTDTSTAAASERTTSAPAATTSAAASTETSPSAAPAEARKPADASQKSATPAGGSNGGKTPPQAESTASKSPAETAADSVPVPQMPSVTDWLVGVPLNGEVYLFDPAIGLPIPSLAHVGETPLVTNAATLKEATENDGVFRQLDISSERPYPWSADRLNQLTWEIIGNATLWSKRMEVLQLSLTGDKAAVVFDRLTDTDRFTGSISRVVESSGQAVAADAVTAWSYPETQIEAFEHLTDEQHQLFEYITFPLRMPLEFDPKLGPDGQSVISANESETNNQHKTRIRQLQGEYSQAITAYLTIRLACAVDPAMPITNEQRGILGATARDAFFWIGICQFENGDVPTAVKTYRDYIRRYQQSPWTLQANLQLAIALAFDNKLVGATAILGPATTPTGEQFAYHYLVSRWEKLRDTASTSSNNEPQ